MNQPLKSIVLLTVLSITTTLRADLKEPETETRTWLGVATAEVHPTLQQHLELDEGFGVLISHIPSDSPAHEAGLKAGDVLTLLDDQILTVPEHLSILVRSKKKGDEVSLTYLRKGKELKTVATLGEKEVPVMARYPKFPPMAQPPSNDWQNWHDNLRRFNWKEPMSNRERIHDGQSRSPRQDRAKRPDSVPMPPPKPDQRPTVRDQSTVNINNDQGEVRIEKTNGKGRIEILDATGNEIFKGPYDSVKGIEGLPDKARKQLELMNVSGLEILAPRKDPGGPKPNQDEPAQ